MPRRGENIHKRVDGRWEGRFIKEYDEFGKSKYGSVYGKTYLEVKRKLIEAINQFPKKDVDKQPKKILFQEVLFLWLEHNKLNLREQTHAKYQRLINQHIIPNLGMIQANKINDITINRFINQKSTSGRIDGKGGLSSSYIKTISFIIVSSMKYAEKLGMCSTITGNIVKPINKKQPIEVLTLNEQSMLEKTALLDSTHRKLGVFLSLYAGLRIGEVCGLMWDDIDFENNTIKISRTIERIPNNTNERDSKTRLIVGDAKTISSNRIIPIPRPLISLLKDANGRSGSFVIPGNSYPYIDPRTYQYTFHKYLKQGNLRNINYHTLRHTFATRCIESGMDMKTLSELLGHSSVNITLGTYVHSSLELKRNKLDDMVTFCGQ